MLRSMITFVGVVVILSLAAMAMLVGLNKVNCDSFKQASGLDVRSTLWNCYVKTEKGLIEVDRYQLELIYKDIK